jgi:hypothetical protein
MKFNCSYNELVEIHKLVKNPKNANIHSDDQIERLAKIIDFQGQRSPIVVSKLSGFIVKGHGRLEAIKSLGWQQVAVDYQDYDNEAQEYADLIADNEIARWAHLDSAKLDLDLDIDLDFLGIKNFETPDVDSIDDITSSIDDDKKFILEVEFPNDMEMMDIQDELMAKGYMTKVK